MESSVDAGGLEVAEQAGHGPAGARDPAADVAAVDLDVDSAMRAELVARRRVDLVVGGDLEVDQVAGRPGP